MESIGRLVKTKRLNIIFIGIVPRQNHQWGLHHNTRPYGSVYPGDDVLTNILILKAKNNIDVMRKVANFVICNNNLLTKS